MYESVDSYLQHFGVKGMRWGVRRENNAGATEVTIKQKTPGRRPKIVTSKGGGQAPAKDAVDAKILRRTAKKSGAQALSNKELQALVNRINLEKQYKTLLPQDQTAIKRGQDFLKKLSGGARTVNEALLFQTTPAGKIVRQGLNRS